MDGLFVPLRTQITLFASDLPSKLLDTTTKMPQGIAMRGAPLLTLTVLLAIAATVRLPPVVCVSRYDKSESKSEATAGSTSDNKPEYAYEEGLPVPTQFPSTNEKYASPTMVSKAKADGLDAQASLKKEKEKEKFDKSASSKEKKDKSNDLDKYASPKKQNEEKSDDSSDSTTAIKKEKQETSSDSDESASTHKKEKKEKADGSDESASPNKKEKEEKSKCSDESSSPKKEKSDDSDEPASPEKEKKEKKDKFDGSDESPSPKKEKKKKSDDSEESTTLSKKVKNDESDGSDEYASAKKKEKKKKEKDDDESAYSSKKEKKEKKKEKSEESSSYNKKEKSEEEPVPVDVSTTGEYAPPSKTSKEEPAKSSSSTPDQPSGGYVSPKTITTTGPKKPAPVVEPAKASTTSADVYASSGKQVVSHPMDGGAPDEQPAAPAVKSSPKQQPMGGAPDEQQPMGGAPDEQPPSAKSSPSTADAYAFPDEQPPSTAADAYAAPKPKVTLDSLPMAAAAGGNPASTNPVVKSVCGKTDAPGLCESSIAGLPSPPPAQLDGAGVLKLAMEAVRLKVVEAINAATDRMHAPGTDAVSRNALNACLESYDDMKSSMDTVADALDIGDHGTAATNLDTVSTDVDTCAEGFAEHDLPPLMADYNDYLGKLCSNLLAIGTAIQH